MSYVAYDAWILKNNSIFMKLMHDVCKVEFLSRISIWIPKYIFARYENFWTYCKKIDINKYYSEFYEDHILFQQFLQKKQP